MDSDETDQGDGYIVTWEGGRNYHYLPVCVYQLMEAGVKINTKCTLVFL